MVQNTPSTTPGPSLRKIIEASGLNIGEAAKLMGISRQALSTVLNGKSTLTAEMAERFATAFPTSANKVRELQATEEQTANREQAREIMVRTHVPKFLGITARDIEAWADGNIAARGLLPALLRRLVNGSGVPLSEVDFPAGNNSQRHGWDGWVVAEAASPWVPRGRSGWEFGCDQNPSAKANGDYKQRTDNVPPIERADTALIFVTPRRWTGKDSWAAAKRAEGAWKEVRAFDASDLEQWLEQCPAAQAWFGEQVGSSEVQGLVSLEKAWAGWANAAEPPLSKILFRRSVETHGGRLQGWLAQPPQKPLIVAADSDDEAISFLVCALETLGQPAGRDFDGALIVKTPEALARVGSLGAKLILITDKAEVELAYAALVNPPHLIIARRRNSLLIEPDITLDLVDWETFTAALRDMGFEHPEDQRYSAATANSPTLLRRHLAKLPAVREPKWATDKTTARKLIPLMFAGVWNTEKKADIEVMLCLTRAKTADEMEQTVTELSAVEDAPTWSAGDFRGITSKIDVMRATKDFLIWKDLEDFLVVAQYVLDEDDPALDLAPDQQYMAGIRGKVREHSPALRKGICETLVLLAAHGDAWFGNRFGNKKIGNEIGKLIRNLLIPFRGRTWSAHRHDLARYAEAAPDVFLDIVQQDLESDDPQILALMQSADSTLFGSCPRSGLLWALETLAWNPDDLLRVSRLLARLAQIPITDNWGNTPAASLGNIFRVWMPQTAATPQQRNDITTILCREYPKVFWPIIVDQIGTHHSTGHYTSRPEWRNDASGAGQPVENKDAKDLVLPVMEKAMRLAIDWPSHSAKTFGDLVERMVFIPLKEQTEIWDKIDAWAQSGIDDVEKHRLRDRIRESSLTRRAQTRGVVPDSVDRARQAYDLLLPDDVVVRHLWLFEKGWVGESADDEDDDEFNFHKHDAKVAKLRLAALEEIWRQKGYGGVLELSAQSDSDWIIGDLLRQFLPEQEWPDLVGRLVSQGEPPPRKKIDLMIGGVLLRQEEDQRRDLIAGLMARYRREEDCDSAIRLLRAAQFRADTWLHLVDLPQDWQDRYWKEVPAIWQDQTTAEMNILVRQLLRVNRPRPAFHAVHMDFGQVETKLLVELLRTMATSDAGGDEFYRVDQFYLAEAFKSLAKRADLDKAELVSLEFLYAEGLDHTDYGTPTLEEALGSEPLLFIQLVAAVYRRKDGGEDPPEWQIADPARKSRLAVVAYNILRRFKRLPGLREDGTVDIVVLRRWIETVRALGAQYGRAAITDHAIGEMLGRSEKGSDGVWPNSVVCEVLDANASTDMAAGARMGRYNTRGAHYRAAGGAQEWELSQQYKRWAASLASQYPFTARLLQDIARQYDREATMHDTDEEVNKRIRL